jgi:hypothetical protein
MVEHGGKPLSEVLQPQLDELCPSGQVQLTTLSLPGPSPTAHPRPFVMQRTEAELTLSLFETATQTLQQ